MSRVASLKINIDSQYDVSVQDNVIDIKYLNNLYKYSFEKKLDCELIDSSISFKINHDKVSNKSNLRYLKKIIGFHVRDLLNLLNGLKNPFKESIDVVGVGYKVNHDKKNNMLFFSLGYSHDIALVIPDGINAEVVQNKINLSSSDKRNLGMFASYISKSLRRFDKYKGKGLIRAGQFVQRKEFKKK
jgi:large subunit ribosomal protein L6